MEEVGKIREGLLFVLGAKKKDTELLNTQITIYQTRIKKEKKG